MPSPRVRGTLAGVLLVLSVVWLWDANVHGFKGFVSTYIAPVIIIGNLVQAYWSIRESTAKQLKWNGPGQRHHD